MKIINYLFILVFCLSYSQQNNLIVDYTYSIKPKSLPSATVVNSRLTSNNIFSDYEMDFVGNLNFIDEEAGVKGGSVLGIKAKKNPIIFKEHKSKYIYSIERVSMKPFLVKDSMNIFKWKINNTKKEILGYSCQQAIVNYRGRNYTAYFTSEIPFQTGPWKFYGLPGLILQVESDDGVLKLNATKININKEKINIENPFTNIELKPITWNEYIIEYNNKHKELKGYRGPNGGTRSIPKRKIETLVQSKSIMLKD